MPTPLDFWSTAAILLTVVVAMFIPGLLIGAAAGLRGWLLAGSAPLLSYALVGIAGPWFAIVGLPYHLGTVTLFGAMVALLAVVLRRRWPARPDKPTPWTRHAHQGVVVFLLLGVLVGGFTVLWGMGGLHVIPQGFDTPLHANGLRYIAETGDGSLHGMNVVHRWGDTERLFYPNAYHLLGSLLYQITSAPIPAVLNAVSVVTPGLLSLSLVVLIRQFRGRAVFAGAAAVLAVVPATVLYVMLGGPLLPFMLGMALLPLLPALLAYYLDRPSVQTGFVLVLGTVGALSVHSSTVFSFLLFAVPLLAYRWRWNMPRLRKELVALLFAGAAALVVAGPHVVGAIGRAASPYPYSGWPSNRTVVQAVGELFGIREASGITHAALLVITVVGIVTYRRLGRLRWMAATAVVTAVLWVLVASVDNDVVVTMAQPWWDDPVRLIALAGLPLTVLAAHGFSELQRWLRTLLDARVFHPRDLHPSARAAATAVAVIVAFCVASGGFYVRSNTDLVGRAIGHGQVVTPHEARAMLELGKLAAPGEWAMNDRYDGTVWTYALSGVRTVAGHFGGALLPSDAKLLAERFNQYPHDPQVRAAVQRLNIRWVIVGRKGFLPNFGRQPGMTDLHGTPFLREVYRNPDAVIYRIVGAPPVHETDHGQDIAPVAER